jgi:cysteine protease ATG4
MTSNFKDSIQRAFHTIKTNVVSSFRSEDQDCRMNTDGGATWILGKSYYPELDKHEEARLKQDIYSRFYFSYRFDFCPIPASSITTDAGWGCMHRSGQMILAQWLSLMYLGRDWAIDPILITGSKLHPRKSVSKWNQYVKILNFFIEGRLGQNSQVIDHTDQDSNRDSFCKADMNDLGVDKTRDPFNLFSIQFLATMGTRFHKEVGHWFGPSTLACIFKEIIESDSRFQGIRVVVPHMNGGPPTFLLEDLLPTSDPSPCLLFIPVRLGIQSIHPIYVDALKAALGSPFCLGIAGGKSNSSFYCIGYHNESLLCLDPHKLQVSLSDPLHEFITCHTIDINKVQIVDVDPSLMLGFFLKDQSTIEAFYQSYQDQPDNGRIYHIEAREKKGDMFTDDKDASSSHPSTMDINSLDDLAFDETVYNEV